MILRPFPRSARHLAAAPADFPVNKALICAVAGVTSLGAFAADWNDTHIHTIRMAISPAGLECLVAAALASPEGSGGDNVIDRKGSVPA